MNHLPRVRIYFIVLSAALLSLALLLTACASIEVVIPTQTPGQPPPASATAAPVQPTPTQVAQPTQTAVQPTPTSASQPAPTSASADPKDPTYTLDLNGVAQSAAAETVAAVPVSDQSPYWGALPQHLQVTLAGYPISGHLMQPQIFIYPAKDLPGWNEAAGKQAADLQALLASRQDADHLPQMPLYNAAQVMHAQVKFLDFKNGQGVRFVTEYDQAVLPLNNHELIYTYQGLTSDGQYYVAAVLPLNYPGLAASEVDVPEPAGQFNATFKTYLADMVKTLNEAPTDKFTPDLAKLDAMMASLEVK